MKRTKRKFTKPEKEQRLFTKRLRSIFANMRRRLGKLPFTCEALHKRMHPSLGLPCPFCAELVLAKTFSLDHRQPISRGGSRRIVNLQMVCARCNRAKADLTHDEYQLLVIFLEEELGPEARKSVLRRLRASPPWLR